MCLFPSCAKVINKVPVYFLYNQVPSTCTIGLQYQTLLCMVQKPKRLFGMLSYLEPDSLFQWLVRSKNLWLFQEENHSWLGDIWITVCMIPPSFHTLAQLPFVLSSMLLCRWFCRCRLFLFLQSTLVLKMLNLFLSMARFVLQSSCSLTWNDLEKSCVSHIDENLPVFLSPTS